MSRLDEILDPFMDTGDETAVEGGIADAATTAALWGSTRFMVVDTETTSDGDNLRCVSVAVVTCRNGFVLGKWQSLINPGVEVDHASQRIHGLSDEHLAGQPMFSDVAETLRNLMTPADGEQVVVVAHNVRFDVGVLRDEFAKLDEALPELPVLDTMGKWPRLVRLGIDGNSLLDLCGALGIVHDRPHDAMADATVCAEAAVALMQLTANVGVRSIDDLLAGVSEGATTHTVKSVSAKALRSRPSEQMLPEEHMEGHSEILGPRAGKRMLEAWAGEVADCAKLRCRHLADRVAMAGPDAAKLLPYLDSVLDDLCNSGDTAGAATVLGAMQPVLGERQPLPGRGGQRRSQLAWAKARVVALDALGRCEAPDLCPDCRNGEPCPLDSWVATIALHALGDPATSAQGFLLTTGKDAGTGSYVTWCAKGLGAVADAALWNCAIYWRSAGHPNRADQLVDIAWRAGCRQPDIVEAYAGQLAAPGRRRDLKAALAAANAALRTANGNTMDGWSKLRGRIAQLEARQERLNVRLSKKVDAQGNVIPYRNHSATTPRRTRPARFMLSDQ